MTVLDAGCGMGFFTIGMARLLKGKGKVLAVDLQEGMLESLRRRAIKAGVADTITPVLCTPGSLGIEGPVDFALAFWMVHETPDRAAFLSEAHSVLRPGGQLLITEPLFHVSAKAFNETLALAWHAGFRVVSSPKVSFSRTVLLRKQ
jgi:ubiquinone/menaquinone biosynthesis C-methylase UbiE